MKSILWTAALIGSLVTLAGCSTMRFTRGGSNELAAKSSSDWHHDGLGRGVELSRPVSLFKKCGGDEWTSVKIEQTFAQGLIGHAQGPFSLYEPWNVTTSCQ